jgi:hypothetical protein
VVRHGETDDDPVYLPTAFPELRNTQADEETALEALIIQAKDNGISEPGAITLSALVHQFRDIWRIDLGNDPPSKVSPMVTKLEPGASPLCVRVRR